MTPEITGSWSIRNVRTALIQQVVAAAKDKRLTVGEWVTLACEAALASGFDVAVTPQERTDLAALRAEFEELKRQMNVQGHALLNLGDLVANPPRTPEDRAEIQKWLDATRQTGW